MGKGTIDSQLSLADGIQILPDTYSYDHVRVVRDHIARAKFELAKALEKIPELLQIQATSIARNLGGIELVAPAPVYPDSLADGLIQLSWFMEKEFNLKPKPRATGIVGRVHRNRRTAPVIEQLSHWSEWYEQAHQEDMRRSAPKNQKEQKNKKKEEKVHDLVLLQRSNRQPLHTTKEE